MGDTNEQVRKQGKQESRESRESREQGAGKAGSRESRKQGKQGAGSSDSGIDEWMEKQMLRERGVLILISAQLLLAVWIATALQRLHLCLLFRLACHGCFGDSGSHDRG